MIEASTFNKSSKEESALLQKLRSDNPITETEPSDKAKLLRNSQFSVNRNSKCYVGSNSAVGCSTSYQRTSDIRKKHLRNKDDSHTKSVVNTNPLQKGIHQFQSLQDLMSSDLSKSKQKSHKAHRTHSLSSDEVTGIDSESLIPKVGKKSSKLLGSSSKSEMNKNSIKENSKFLQNSSLASNFSDSKQLSSDLKDTLPYESSSLNDSDISFVNSRKEQNDVNISPPIEIEMAEIKSDKMSFQEDDSISGNQEVEKTLNGPVQSNSKFYVDCQDIDTTVTFPLKLMSSIDDQNNDSMNEQLKRFPLVPWPRPLQVQSFFSSLPMESDSFGSRNDKQLLNTDINGNPFVRNTRASNLASFVSSSLMDYTNGSLMSESKNRKNKRLRNSVKQGVLAENIAGHRGEEDIDTLLQYINSSDKKGKSTNKTLLHENERKKPLNKEMKNGPKSSLNGVKKKLTRSNSLENIPTKSLEDQENSISFVSRVLVPEPEIVKSETLSESSISKSLDINSNEESKGNEDMEHDKEISSTVSSPNCFFDSPSEIGSFSADTFSTVNVSSQTVEESGFLIVKKKQRKKHQGKRSETYRWRNAQNQRKKGIMLPLAESKCGKQDSRRKSTSSVPHSEHSSVDNSDLDSVHSLPVRGSVPHPTQPHPHTTPSSSSSTPQASYADIARMPISKLNSTPPSIINCNSQSSAKPHSGDQEAKRMENSTSNGSNPTKRKTSEPRDSTSSIKVTPHNSSLTDRESDSSGTSDIKVRSSAKSTREINTQTEPESISSEIKKVECASNKATKKEETSPKTLCNTCLCSSRKDICSCSKSHQCPRAKAKSIDIPPVIMDNMPPDMNTCNFSFGFGIEEVLEMAPATANSMNLVQNNSLSPTDLREGSSNEVEKSDGVFEISSVNINKTDTVCSSKSPILLNAPSKSLASEDLKNEQSSHLKTICYGTGRNICYNETKVNVKKFNLSEIASFLGSEFHNVEKEIEGIKSNKNSSKVMYYVDSSEDA